MRANYYRGVEGEPYHLSVGAVLLNDRREVACHHFKQIHGLQDIYILMRETMEPGESLDLTIQRGLMEEFGAKAKLGAYIGSLVVPVKDTTQTFQKTTLYFLCDLIKIRPEWRKPDDEEKDSQVLWKNITELKAVMVEQGKRYHRPDLNESEVLERVERMVSGEKARG